MAIWQRPVRNAKCKLHWQLPRFIPPPHFPFLSFPALESPFPNSRSPIRLFSSDITHCICHILDKCIVHCMQFGCMYCRHSSNISSNSNSNSNMQQQTLQLCLALGLELVNLLDNKPKTRRSSHHRQQQQQQQLPAAISGKWMSLNCPKHCGRKGAFVRQKYLKSGNLWKCFSKVKSKRIVNSDYGNTKYENSKGILFYLKRNTANSLDTIFLIWNVSYTVNL